MPGLDADPGDFRVGLDGFVTAVAPNFVSIINLFEYFSPILSVTHTLYSPLCV